MLRLFHRKDLPNLRQMKDEKELLEEERLLETLLIGDVSSSVILTVDSGVGLEMIYLQTTATKKSMLKFPEAILMDSTYRCNNLKIPLSSIMVMDGNVRGQIVAHALLKSVTVVNALCFLLIRISMRWLT